MGADNSYKKLIAGFNPINTINYISTNYILVKLKYLVVGIINSSIL